MDIKVNPKRELTYYPDIGDNLEKSQGERFGVVFVRKNSYVLATQAVSQGIFKGKNKTNIDVEAFLSYMIKEFVNPPILDFGEEKREMRIVDLFEYNEMKGLVKDLFDKAIEITGDQIDKKKS